MIVGHALVGVHSRFTKKAGETMEVKDKVAVVTGAGSGIGRALAERLARDGATAVVCADLNGDRRVDGRPTRLGRALPKLPAGINRAYFDTVTLRQAGTGGH